MKPGERIRQLRKAKGLTLNELAQLTESDVGNLSRLERGRQGFSEIMLQKIATALSVKVATLFSAEETDDTVHNNSTHPTAGRDDVFRIDLLDISASAGSGTPSRDVIEIVRSIEYQPEQARQIFGPLPDRSVKLINVRGDSMEGTLEPGDLIFVDITVDTFDGDGIYVFDFNGDMFVKRLQRVKSCLYVISDNPRYKEWTISEDELPMLHVAGRVLLSQSQQYRRHG